MDPLYGPYGFQTFPSSFHASDTYNGMKGMLARTCCGDQRLSPSKKMDEVFPGGKKTQQNVEIPLEINMSPKKGPFQ